MFLFFVVKTIVDNYAASCCSHYMVASIVMSSKMMMEQRFVKGFKREGNSMLTKHLNQRCQTYSVLRATFAYLDFIRARLYRKIFGDYSFSGQRSSEFVQCSPK